MQTEKYQRKPVFVDAIQVTEENMEEVAKWCKGKILETQSSVASDPATAPIVRFIKAKVYNPLSNRQTEAFVTDWVVQQNGSFKIFPDKSFQRTFESVFQEPAIDEVVEGGEMTAVSGEIETVFVVNESPVENERSEIINPVDEAAANDGCCATKVEDHQPATNAYCVFAPRDDPNSVDSDRGEMIIDETPIDPDKLLLEDQTLSEEALRAALEAAPEPTLGGIEPKVNAEGHSHPADQGCPRSCPSNPKYEES